MNYSLGNMLSRGGALNPYGLSLDLAFAADKTLTARKGPTPTFTRASTATFVGSNGLIQSAAINAPRFDHDPVTLACKGLLIEEQRTNLLLHSENFNNAYWLTTSGATTWQGIGSAPVITANYAASPSGLLSAYRLQLNLNGSTSSSDRSGFATGILSVTSGATYTVSVYIKLLDGTTDAQLLASNIGIFTVAASATSQSIQDAGNGWKRIIRTYTSTSASGTYRFQIVGGAGLNQVDCIIWGAQVEAGSFPTSYIPTTTTALTRSADVCSITGADFTSFWNQSEGSIFSEFSMISGFSIAGRAIPICQASNNTFNELIRLGTATASLFQVLDTSIGASQTRVIATTALSLTAKNKSAAAYKVGNNGISSNSSAVATSSPASISSSIIRFDIGALHPASGQPALCGHIARIQYFNKRLPNAKLQSLTT